MYITSFSLNLIPIYPAQKAQIALLVTKKVKIPTKYSDFSDVFLKEKALILLKITKLNQYAIKLQEGQQLSYELIYSLGPIKLEILKIYLKTNLANSFILPLKLPTSTLILFIRKPDSSLRLCVNY